MSRKPACVKKIMVIDLVSSTDVYSDNRQKSVASKVQFFSPIMIKCKVDSANREARGVMVISSCVVRDNVNALNVCQRIRWGRCISKKIMLLNYPLPMRGLSVIFKLNNTTTIQISGEHNK